MFVCAGKLPCIEVYDETTCQKVVEFKSTIGHNNKIFCAKFDCEDSNIIYSGGWDRQVLFWDVRQGKKQTGQISGPEICGDSIDSDSRNFQLLTGSHTKKESLQIWDTRTLGST